MYDLYNHAYSGHPVYIYTTDMEITVYLFTQSLAKENDKIIKLKNKVNILILINKFNLVHKLLTIYQSSNLSSNLFYSLQIRFNFRLILNLFIYTTPAIPTSPYT